MSATGGPPPGWTGSWGYSAPATPAAAGTEATGRDMTSVYVLAGMAGIAIVTVVFIWRNSK